MILLVIYKEEVNGKVELAVLVRVEYLVLLVTKIVTDVNGDNNGVVVKVLEFVLELVMELVILVDDDDDDVTVVFAVAVLVNLVVVIVEVLAFFKKIRIFYFTKSVFLSQFKKIAIFCSQ